MCVAVPLVILGIVFVVDGDDSPGDTDDAPAGAIEAGKAEVGSVAPDFELSALDGSVERLSDYRGRPVIVTFFASWCHPCEDEFPLLERAVAEHDELQVLAIAYEDLPNDSAAFVERMGATFPALLDAGDSVATSYGVRGIPQTFFIDADGVVRDRVFGITSQSALDPPLDTLLAGAIEPE